MSWTPLARTAALLLASLSVPVRAQTPARAAPRASAVSAPTAADAKTFVDGVNAELKRLTIRAAASDWIRSTYITDDTERNAAAMNEDLCAAAGWKGPLHACSIYGSKEAGRRLEKMMAMGASRPWPDAMEALTGQRKADASALLEYYAPLRAWLHEQNAGQKCGW